MATWFVYEVVLATPWLLPFAYGPMPSAMGVVFSAICVLFCIALLGRASTQHVVKAWLVASVLSSCMGVVQYFGVSSFFSPWIQLASAGEAFGNLRQRNQFATLTGIGFLALLWLELIGGSQDTSIRARGRAERVAVQIACALLATANVASGSRTGLLQWAFICGLTQYWRKTTHRNVAYLGVSAVGYYVFAAIALPYALEALSGREAGSVFARFAEPTGCGSRLVLWSNVISLVAQRPWTGWGWGELDYAHFINIYSEKRFCEILDNAHNLPLHLAVELGLPIAALFCGAFGWLVWRNRPWAETDPTRQFAWGVLAVIGFHSMLEYPLWYGQFQLAVLLCIWILWRIPHQRQRPIESTCLSWTKRKLVALGILGACAITAWDYWRISQLYLPPTARTAKYREDTLAKVRNTWFFSDQVKFAELTTTELTADTAAFIHELALEMMHFSPEPRVIEKVIESAVMLDRDDEALFYLQRYKTAFPIQHARWSAAFKTPE